MKIPIYQVDAFASQIFTGNPAAVCPLDKWLEDGLMQSIAAENNLSETAFFVSANNQFDIRWFTPKGEVDLCGHATLASAHVLFSHLSYENDTITFNSKSGLLRVNRLKNGYKMEFPADFVQKVDKIAFFSNILNIEIKGTFLGRDDYLVLIRNEEELRNLKPIFRDLMTIQSRGIIVSCQGTATDFVSRCFYPKYGIDEDPVTGSAHTCLTPFWAKRLNKNLLTAAQLSPRGGLLTCELQGDRVLLSGNAMSFLVGEIHLPD